MGVGRCIPGVRSAREQYKVDVQSITCCFAGAAPLAAETKQRFEALTGGRIVEGYSLTEAMSSAVMRYPRRCWWAKSCAAR